MLPAAIVVACLPLRLHAQSSPFSGTLALNSQLVDRGLAITRSTPILQGAASWNSPGGWTLGAAAGVQARAPGRMAEALVQGARSWSLSDSWQMQANLLYYDYGSGARVRLYDRAEVGAHWIYRDVLTVGVSAIHAINGHHDKPMPAGDLTVHWPLPGGFSLTGGIGVAQYLLPPRGHYYDSRAFTYRYGDAGVAWTHGPWRLALDRIATDLSLPSGSRGPGAPRWVGSVSVGF